VSYLPAGHYPEGWDPPVQVAEGHQIRLYRSGPRSVVACSCGEKIAEYDPVGGMQYPKQRHAEHRGAL
jgi:hypothetical protein